jgi:anti-sigma regulatory factor (Ser/Thr protein kinase)
MTATRETKSSRQDGKRTASVDSCTSAIPAHPVACFALPAETSAPSLARSHACMVLDWWGIGPEAIETARLLISELVTNALNVVTMRRSGNSRNPARAEQISLQLRHVGYSLRIEVSDPDMQRPVLANAGLDSDGGRGLMLVDALSSKWGYYFPDGGGKIVYCEIKLQGAVRKEIQRESE